MSAGVIIIAAIVLCAYDRSMHWIDLHNDTLRFVLDLGVDPLERVPGIHVDLPRLRRAGVKAAVWAIWVEAEDEATDATVRALRMLGGGLSLASRSGGRLRPILGADDLRRCLSGDAVGMIFGLEGAHPLQGNPEMLRAFHALGLRLLTLTWNRGNSFAAGCSVSPEEDRGLSASGRGLLELAQDLGILVDLAHASRRTLADALPLMRRPFLVSHTACAALAPHRRNLTDSQMREVAAAGGLIGIAVFPGFLSTEGDRVNVARVVDHMLHAIEKAGVDSVGLGTDLDGIESLPEGFAGVQDLGKIGSELERRGLQAGALGKVSWENAARVIQAALG